MSQRECAGFNWPPLSIPAQEPVSISPEAVNRAGPGSSVKACSLKGLPRVCSDRDARNSGVPLALRQSLALDVAQPVKHATAARSGPWLRIASISPPSNVRTPFSASAAVGVGHPEKSISDVRRTDARRRKRDGPEGVAQTFQVSVYKVEPRFCILACNLLSKDRWRAALLDEPVEVRPQVPLVSKPRSFACLAERLARTGTSPNRSVIRPSGEPKGVAPDADSGEEMALRESTQVVRSDILNAPFVHDAWRNVPSIDQVAHPLGCEWLDLVVVVHRVALSCPRLLAFWLRHTSMRAWAATMRQRNNSSSWTAICIAFR